MLLPATVDENETGRAVDRETAPVLLEQVRFQFGFGPQRNRFGCFLPMLAPIGGDKVMLRVASFEQNRARRILAEDVPFNYQFLPGFGECNNISDTDHRRCAY